MTHGPSERIPKRKPKKQSGFPAPAGRPVVGKGPMLHEGLRVTGQRRGTRKR